MRLIMGSDSLSVSAGSRAKEHPPGPGGSGGRALPDGFSPRPNRRPGSASLLWPPRKIRATIATIAMSARINAYSARAWPSFVPVKGAEELEIHVRNDRHFVPPGWISTPKRGRGQYTSARMRQTLRRWGYGCCCVTLGIRHPPVAVGVPIRLRTSARVPPKTPRISAVNVLVRARMRPYSTSPCPPSRPGRPDMP